MKYLLPSLMIIILFNCVHSIQAQKVETTYNWGSFDHSCWKVQAFDYGYVMVGNKFFEPGNTSLYIQGFRENGKSLFLRQHTPAGFTSLQTIWKSFVVNTAKSRIFSVVAGTQSGPKAYALLTDDEGRKIWDRVIPIANGIQYAGVTNARNSGWLACGGDAGGNMLVTKFDGQGNIVWTKTYPHSAFAWTIIQAPDNGYILAGTRKIIRIDENGTLVWATTLTLPPPPSPDGSSYTYTEFEELIVLPLSTGVGLTGSAFSNSTSAAYTAAIDYNGTQVWSTIHEPRNTALSGTPVSWISSAITEGFSLVTSWRTGPVSGGGVMHYARTFLLNGFSGPLQSLENTIPVQEAFLIKNNDQYIVGGTRGGYTAAYSYVNSELPLGPIPLASLELRGSDETLPFTDAVQKNSGLERINFNNTEPKYKVHPASRVFRSEMQVFPNPSINGIVNVGGRLESGATLRVTDIMGRIVMEKQINTGDTQVELNLKSQGKGIYNVELVGSGQITSKKVILQ